jgi:hypothetical protein
MATKGSRNNYQDEIAEIRAQGVFALDPTHVTTPLRMAAYAQAPNGREAKEVAAAVDVAEKLGPHQLLTVGEFFDTHRVWKKSRRKAK